MVSIAGKLEPADPAYTDTQTAARRYVSQIWPVLGTGLYARPQWTAAELDVALRAAGAEPPLVGFLDLPVTEQRDWLSDPDHDDVVSLGEHLAGTDPQRWDSDGDGWWDGAPAHPDTAVPSPEYGALRVRCPDGHVPSVEGARPGFGPWSLEDGGATWLGRDSSTTRREPSVGGFWVDAPGCAVDSPCRFDPAPETWRGPDFVVCAPESLPELVGALRREFDRLGHAVGLRRGPPLQLVVTAAAFRPDSDPMSVPLAVLRRLGVDATAGLVAALDRTRRRGDSLNAAAALFRWLHPGVGLALGDPERVAAWDAAVAACPGGWSSVLRLDCRTP
ncbi:MAG: hypothetical protein ABMA64_25175 [Myxococcota bacterium]